MDQVGQLVANMDISMFVLGIFFILCYMTLNALLWHRILHSFNIRSRLLDTLWTFYMSMFGKYIPGSIWLAASRVFSLKAGTNKRKEILATIILEHLYIVLSGVLCFLLVWTWSEHFVYELFAPILLFFTLALFILIAYPQIWIHILNSLFKLLKRDTIELTIDRKKSFLLLLLYLTTWLFNCTGVWFIASSLGSIPLSDFFLLGSAFALSFSLGFAVLPAPGGLGVREGVFIALVTLLQPNYVAVLIALAMRIAFTICEVLGFLITLFFKVSRKSLRSPS